MPFRMNSLPFSPSESMILYRTVFPETVAVMHRESILIRVYHTDSVTQEWASTAADLSLPASRS